MTPEPRLPHCIQRLWHGQEGRGAATDAGTSPSHVCSRSTSVVPLYLAHRNTDGFCFRPYGLHERASMPVGTAVAPAGWARSRGGSRGGSRGRSRGRAPHGQGPPLLGVAPGVHTLSRARTRLARVLCTPHYAGHSSLDRVHRVAQLAANHTRATTCATAVYRVARSRATSRPRRRSDEPRRAPASNSLDVIRGCGSGRSVAEEGSWRWKG
mmetsp:Transcript_27553/g.70175  ORF Transcript_27553/g.70175 Transcript_27553/m.70175 type:complete len:211 (+) Transcript_27553:79-711(+)